MKVNKFRRFYVKLIKSEGTPTSIARGVAIGLAVGLIIPVGLQTLPAIFLAFVFKANKVLTWTFTCVTNPATAIVIYPFKCWIGGFLLFSPMKMDHLAEEFHDLLHAETLIGGWNAFTSLGWDILLPFFAGGLFFALLAAPLGYILSFKAVAAYHARRERRRLRLMQSKRNDSGNESASV